MEKYLMMYENFKLALFTTAADADMAEELVLNQNVAKYLPVGIHTGGQ